MVKRNDPVKESLQDRLMAAVIHDVVCEHTQSRWPTTYAGYKAAFFRFGGRKIRLIDRQVLEAPFLRNKVLYMPLPRTREQIKVWFCHELSHLVLEWEGVPPLVYPACWGDYEHWARVMEEIAGGKRPCPEEWDIDKGQVSILQLLTSVS